MFIGDYFLGNNKIVETLSAMISRGRLSHAILLSGEKGIGKHTLANIIAMGHVCLSRELKPCGFCEHCKSVLHGICPDVHYIDLQEGKTFISVDQIREIIADSNRKPNVCQKNVYIIEAADKMNPNAQNALLKSLEEPSQWSAFILLAENIDAILPTIISRVVSFELTPVSLEEAVSKLKELFKYTDIKEIKKAASICEGNIGKTIDYLNKGIFFEIDDYSNQVTNFILSRKEFDLLVLLSNMDKYLLPRIFEATINKFIEKSTNGIYEYDKIVKLHSLFSEFNKRLLQNGNISLILSDLCSKLMLI